MKKNLIRFFWAPEFGRPDQYTGFPNDLDTSLEEIFTEPKVQVANSRLAIFSLLLVMAF